MRQMERNGISVMSPSTRLVVPTSLQMGWVESPAYFCAASETGRDVASRYAEMKLGSLPPHKFTELTQTHDDFKALPHATDGNSSRHMLMTTCLWPLPLPSSNSTIFHQR